MKFEKGQSGNPAGRPKRTAQKISIGLRQNLAYFLEERFTDVAKNYKTLTPYEQIRLYMGLMPYVMCKRDDIPIYKLEEADLDLMLDITREEFERLTNEREEAIAAKKSNLNTHTEGVGV